MALIETEEAARRLARTVASDLSLQPRENREGPRRRQSLRRARGGDRGGRALYERRVSPEIYRRNFYDRALVDVLIKSKGHIRSKVW